MRKLIFMILLAIGLQCVGVNAQNRMYPNAIHAKLNLIDYGTLYDGSHQVSEGFEFAFLRNIAPYLNVGVPVKIGLAKLPNTTGNTVMASGDLIFHLENMSAESKVLPYAFGGAGYAIEGFNTGYLQFPFGAGLNIRLSPFAFLNFQGEYRKAMADDRDNIHIGIGYVYLLHKMEPKPVLPPDQDQDGTPDNLDKCPNQPGSAAAFGCPDADNDGVADGADECGTDPGPATTNGCPDYDSDGVADKNDDCPTEAGTLKGCPDTDGDGFADKADECPTTAGSIKGCPDADIDGISDPEDKCPTEPGPASNMGCPVKEVKDGDQDGVPDEEDQCPTAAGNLKGCPDFDNDGVADKDDKCPTVAGVAANNGCPVVKDWDGDGVSDEVDACPSVAGTLNGCPDGDNDGVADKDDKCPTVSGPVSNMGCPVAKDADNDGVADENDPCPKVAGTFNGCPDTDNDGVGDDKDKCPTTPGIVANSGCPEIKQEVKERLAFATKAVQFETGKAVLKSESYAVLDEVVGIMRQYPDYVLAVSGYTDDVGNDAANLKLSQERAKACSDYLLFRGVKTERLRYAGFGEARPIASNKTPEGREANRRVEFELILQ